MTSLVPKLDQALGRARGQTWHQSRCATASTTDVHISRHHCRCEILTCAYLPGFHAIPVSGIASGDAVYVRGDFELCTSAKVFVLAESAPNN